MMKYSSLNRLALWLFIAATILPYASQGAAHASQRKELAILLSKDLPIYRQTLEAVQKELPPTIAIRVFNLTNQTATNRRISNRLKSYPFDCIVSIGAKATKMAIEIHGNRHVVSCMTLLSPEIAKEASHNVHILPYLPQGKDFIKVLKEKCPRKKRIGLLWSDEVLAKIVNDFERDFQKEGYTFSAKHLSSQRNLPRDLKELSREIDLFLLLPDPLLLQKEALRHVLLQLLQNEIPVFTFSPSLVRAGALFGLSYPIEDVGKQVGQMVNECIMDFRPTSEEIEPKLTMNERVATFLKMDN